MADKSTEPEAPAEAASDTPPGIRRSRTPRCQMASPTWTAGPSTPPERCLELADLEALRTWGSRTPGHTTKLGLPMGDLGGGL